MLLPRKGGRGGDRRHRRLVMRNKNNFHIASSSSPSPSFNAKSTDADDEEEEEFDQTVHLSILDRNLKRFSKQGLLEWMGLLGNRNDHDDDSSEEGWDDEVHMNLRFALMSHGSVNGMDGPTNNYVNFGACSAFQLSRDALLNMPACRVAAPGLDQEAWSMRLQTLREDPENWIDIYQGYRSTLVDGRRFYIRDAVVWNCYTDDGEYYGQAILFDRQKVSYPEQQRTGTL